MKSTIDRNGQLILKPESGIESYAVGLWKQKIEEEYIGNVPPIEVSGELMPVAIKQHNSEK